MDEITLKRRIDAAAKRIPADLIIKNGKVIDVFNLEIIEADIAIIDGYIAGIGFYDEADEIVDAAGRYVSPAFIDAHVHIESSMVTPVEFSKVLLAHGVTTVITDPHEIANVSGTKGISYMLQQSENLPLDVRVMLPSCVPSTPFENAGAVLEADRLHPFYKHNRVPGLAEVMDYPAVLHGKKEMLDKLLSAANHKAIIDGHGAGLDADGINVYASSGISTDHECTTAEEARDRITRGLYVLIREGSVAKDLAALLPAVTSANASRFMFCTDDKHLDDLVAEGSVDHNVRLAIKQGMDSIQAIQLCSLNAAKCYRLNDKGAIAPGYKADFLVLDDLENVAIASVYAEGKLVAKDGSYCGPELNQQAPPKALTDSIHIAPLSVEHFVIGLKKGDHANVIEVIPNKLVTKKVTAAVGEHFPSATDDLLKIAVIERHNKTGNIGLGIVKGLRLQDGAIASTVAHDSHNLVVAGTNDRDMMTASAEIQNMKGGYVIVKDGEVLASVPLPISGLMSDRSFEQVNDEILHLKSKLNELGFDGDFDPFLTLSFLTLPVIPEIKLTDMGLFDFRRFSHISLKA
ncbi:adenine deaminase [Fictibacillus iocasae]|uniref:Adenine deaminase n=1 Tax=Fictibacillus iocasae TaxID=2715437 RepID=A0ABW2NQ63_9BACL